MTKYGAKKTVYDPLTHTLTPFTNDHSDDAIVFDSKAEAEYYIHLLYLQRKGEIKSIRLQPCYLLQESFTKMGKKYQRIDYIADFELETPDGDLITVDVKGFETKDFIIKKKLFERIYESHKLQLVTYVKKYGGWIELDDLKKARKQNKKVV